MTRNAQIFNGLNSNFQYSVFSQYLALLINKAVFILCWKVQFLYFSFLSFVSLGWSLSYWNDFPVCSLDMSRDQMVRCLHVPTVVKPGSSQTITLCGICVPILGKGLILVLNVPSVLPDETTWTVTWRESTGNHWHRLWNDGFGVNRLAPSLAKCCSVETGQLEGVPFTCAFALLCFFWLESQKISIIYFLMLKWSFYKT